MDTAVTIIGLVITILIAIPLYFVFKSNAINKNKIKMLQKSINQNEKFNFEETIDQNKKVYSFDKKNKAFLFMDFNSKNALYKLIDLKKILQCELKYTKDIDTDKTVKIELEFQFKSKQKKESITVYDAKFDLMNQICLYEDDQLAKKWKNKINHCLA